MIIKRLHDFELYADLCQRFGSVYNSSEWLQLFDNIQIFGIFDDNNDLIGGFHLYILKVLFIRVIRDAPFTPTTGPFYDDSNITKHVSRLNLEKKIIASVSSFISSKRFTIISLSLSRKILDTQPFFWKKFKVISQYTYRIPLKKSEEEIWATFSAERRKNIKKIGFDGFKVMQIEDYSKVRQIFIETLLAKGISVKTELTDRILFDFATKDNSICFGVIGENNELFGASFFIYDRNCIYSVLSGYVKQFKHHGIIPATIWEGIKFGKQIGLSYFDFEGSMLPGVENFFRGFGGELTPYFRVNRAPYLLEIVLKIFKRNFF